MNTQQQADQMLAQWQFERAKGIKSEDRLRQDNMSEREWEEEVWLIDYHVSQEDAS